MENFENSQKEEDQLIIIQEELIEYFLLKSVKYVNTCQVPVNNSNKNSSEGVIIFYLKIIHFISKFTSLFYLKKRDF